MKILLSILLLYALLILQSCDPNHHRPTDHPCNFPDAQTENSLRTNKLYVIVDKVTLENLVDTTANAIIHRDSIHLFDENWNDLSNGFKTYSYCPEWAFNNLNVYNNVSFNEPQDLLDLSHKVFYLQISQDDIDTIEVFYSSCLVYKVYFNGQSSAIEGPVHCSATYYFKK